MEEFIHRNGREGDGGEIQHLVAHRVGIKGHSCRILHPRVSDQNPPGRHGCTDDRQPSGSEVEAFAHLVPSEIHDGDKGSLHKECHDALDGQRRTEDVADEPTVVRPVGAELKLHDQAGGDTDGEVDAEEFHPELCCCLPMFFPCLDIQGFHDGLDNTQSQGERDE